MTTTTQITRKTRWFLPLLCFSIVGICNLQAATAMGNGTPPLGPPPPPGIPTEATTSLGTVTAAFADNNMVINHDHAMITITTGTTAIQSLYLYTLDGKVLYENTNVHSNTVILSDLNFCQQTIIVRAIAYDGNTAVKKWLFY